MNLMAINFEIRSESFLHMIFILKNIDNKVSSAMSLQWLIKRKLLIKKVVNIFFFISMQ